MQNTSALYKSIMTNPNHTFETNLVVGYDGDLITEDGDRILFGGDSINIGVTDAGEGYGEEVLMEVSTQNALFGDTPTVGDCVSAEIEVTMLKPAATFKTMAELLPYIRAKDETRVSEWLSKGVYYIDTRSESHNADGIKVLTLHGYDSMLKAERAYPVPNSQMIDWSAYHIGTDSAKSTAAYVEFEKTSSQNPFANFEAGETLKYTAFAEGMSTAGSHNIGDIEFYNGSTLLLSKSIGEQFTVPNDIASATKVRIYGSTYGAHVYNYSFEPVNSLITAETMVRRIIQELNDHIDQSIGPNDVRRLHLLDEDAYKLRHPDPTDRPTLNSEQDTDNGYLFDYVTAALYSCREVLSMIAGAYCANWFIDDNNNLKLAVLNEYPSETSRLMDEAGYQVMFGGVYIRVE